MLTPRPDAPTAAEHEAGEGKMTYAACCFPARATLHACDGAVAGAMRGELHVAL